MTRDPAQRLSDAINAMLDSHADKALAPTRAMLDRYRHVDDIVVPETDEEVIARLATGHDACVVRAAEALAAKDEARGLRNELAEMRQRMQGAESQRAGAIRASGSEAEQDRISLQIDLGARILALEAEPDDLRAEMVRARERLGEVTRELDKHRILDAPNSASSIIESDLDVIRRLAAHYYANPQAPTTAPTQVVQHRCVFRASMGERCVKPARHDGICRFVLGPDPMTGQAPAPVLAIGQVWETPIGWRWQCNLSPPPSNGHHSILPIDAPDHYCRLTIDKGGRIVDSEGCRLITVDDDRIECITGPWHNPTNPKD